MKYTSKRNSLFKIFLSVFLKLELGIESLGEAIFPRPISLDDISKLPRRLHTVDEKHFSLLFYQDQKVKDLIRYLKHYDDNILTKKLAELTYHELIDSKWHQEKIIKDPYDNFVILAVPTTSESFQRYGSRNHIRNFALQIAYIMKLKLLPDNLVLKKNNKKQALLSRTERLQNLNNAFSIQRTEAIYQKNIIIIDDVWTTGATLEKLTLCLMNAGAKNVYAITIAH